MWSAHITLLSGMNYKDHFSQVWTGPAWHGDSITELLEPVSAEMAGIRPVPELHTIAELVHHIITWRQFAIEMLQKNFAYRVEVNSELDWPTIEPCSEDHWKGLRSQLETAQSRLEGLLGTISNAELDTVAGDRPYTVRVIIEGVSDHDMYHCGQIALVKKLIISKG